MFQQYTLQLSTPLCLESCLFPLALPTHLCTYCILPMHAACPTYFIFLDLVTLPVFCRVNIMKPFIIKFSPASSYFIHVRINHSLQHHILKENCKTTILFSTLCYWAAYGKTKDSELSDNRSSPNAI